MTLHYPLHELVPYVNWVYFFHAWGFPPRLASLTESSRCDACFSSWLDGLPEEEHERAIEARQLFMDALAMLTRIGHTYEAHVCLDLRRCYSDGDDIILLPHEDGAESAATRLSFLRQQHPPYLCLSDFIAPRDKMEADTAAHLSVCSTIGLFAACVDGQMEKMYDGTEEYRHLLAQTLADRLAEAAVERAHEETRKRYWGYAAAESLTVRQLHAEQFQGIRPAIGYPSLPDQSLIFDLDSQLGFHRIGIRLTESGAMIPHASVSGLMIAHPAARYFSIGRIGRDQLEAYASRRGLSARRLEPFLAANLS